MKSLESVLAWRDTLERTHVHVSHTHTHTHARTHARTHPHNEVTRESLSWLGLCHNALTPRRHENVMHCRVMWGLSSAVISSLHNSIHPPEMEMSSSEDDVWLPAWQSNTTQTHTQPSQPLAVVHLLTCNCYYIPGDPRVLKWGKQYATTTTRIWF